MTRNTASMTAILGLAGFASLASLALAFIAQYHFGLKPCELCIFQRIPYGIIIILAIAGWFKKSWAYGLCIMIGLLFLADSAIAAYHTAVEKHWIAGPEACTDATANAPMSVEQILAKIKGAPLVACDQPQWEFHGLTMAALNALWALALALSVFRALHVKRKRQIYA